MTRARIRLGLIQVGEALREPEAFTIRWQRGEAPYGLVVWAALAATSALGALTYGMTLGIPFGLGEVLRSGLLLCVAAGLAWAIPLPALYVLNSLTGSRLSASTTLLAALVTTSWGGLALVASIPINWFFTVAVPEPWLHELVNLVVFIGVGVSMADVFSRTIRAVEPERGRAPAWWLLLVGAIGCELFYAFGLLAMGGRR